MSIIHLLPKISLIFDSLRTVRQACTHKINPATHPEGKFMHAPEA